MTTNILYRPIGQATPPLPSGLYTVGEAARLVGFSRDARTDAWLTSDSPRIDTRGFE
jgi:hypothetical protein